MFQFGTSYFGCRFPEHVETDMRYLKECGCSAVLHTFSEEDYFFYRDTMKEIVEVSHRQGLKVYVNPWAVAGVFGGEAFSRFLVQNPETWQLCSDRKRYPTACLSHPKLRQFLLDWVEAAAYIGADAVMWDELHWFLPFLFLESNPQKIWGCRCEYCRHLFHEQFGYIMPEIQTSDVLSFQYTQMRRLLFELSDAVAAKGLKTSVCFLCNTDNFPDNFSQWDDIAGHKSIDIVGTDPYWELGRPMKRSPEEFISFYANKIAEIARKHNKEPQLWIQLYGLKNHYELVQQAAKLAADASIRNIFSWCYRGAKNMSFLRCADPDKAWAQFKKAIKSIQEK